MMSDNTINPQSQVTLHYSIALEDGTVVDSTREDSSPVEFNMGDDVLVDGLKEAITGMKDGDFVILQYGDDPGGKDSLAFFFCFGFVLFDQVQDLVCGIITMNQITLSRLAFEFLICRKNLIRTLFHLVPLS